MPKPELRRRIEQREVLRKILERLDEEPDQEREHRVRCGLFETERRIDELRDAHEAALRRDRLDLERRERESQEATSG